MLFLDKQTQCQLKKKKNQQESLVHIEAASLKDITFQTLADSFIRKRTSSRLGCLVSKERCLLTLTA